DNGVRGRVLGADRAVRSGWPEHDYDEAAGRGDSACLRALKLVGAITGIHREFRTMRANHFNKLTAFVAVAERRNFAKAAKQLGIKASALSQSIRSLEEELGVRLLNRTTRSVAPTEAGERVLGHMRPALESIRKALDAVSDFRDKPMGTLRLVVPSIA